MNPHHSFIPLKPRAYRSSTDRGGEDTPTAFSFVNTHLVRLEISYLSKQGTNVLIRLFGHAQGEGNYHRRRLQNSSSEMGAEVAIYPPYLKEMGP